MGRRPAPLPVRHVFLNHFSKLRIRFLLEPSWEEIAFPITNLKM